MADDEHARGLTFRRHDRKKILRPLDPTNVSSFGDCFSILVIRELLVNCRARCGVVAFAVWPMPKAITAASMRFLRVGSCKLVIRFLVGPRK